MNKTEKRIREILKSYYYRFYLIPKDQCKQKMLIRTLRKKGNVSLAFLVSSLSMWRAQTLYDRLAKDGRFSLDSCRCLGCCGMAPVMKINDDVYGNLTGEELNAILAKYE